MIFLKIVFARKNIFYMLICFPIFFCFFPLYSQVKNNVSGKNISLINKKKFVHGNFISETKCGFENNLKNSVNHFIVSKRFPFHNWERTNPGGGGAFTVIGASANGVIIAGSDLSGAYKSVDGGSTWDVIGLVNGLTETHVSAVGFNHSNGNIIYLGTENGIFRSSDGGSNFTKVLQSGYVTDIEFAIDNPEIGYSPYHSAYNSTDGQIYKSTDNGLTWHKISRNLPMDIRILKIVVNPQNSEVFYCLTGWDRFACSEANVFRSKDGGKTWKNITASFTQEILDIAVDKQNPQILYLTTMNASCDGRYYWTDLDGALYRSYDEGEHWVYLSNYTGVIFLERDNPDRIILIDPREPYEWNERAGTFTSIDGGLTFEKTGDVAHWDTFFNNDPFWCYSVSYNGIVKTFGIDLSNPDVIYWVTNQWVFKSENKGSVFQNVFTEEVSPGFWRSRGLDNVNMMDISVSKADPDIVFLAYFDIGIWRSLDGGNSWQSCNDNVYSGGREGHGGNCATILTDPDRPEVVWASQSENQNGQYPTFLLKNNNTGDRNSWILANEGLPEEQIMGLSIDPNSDVNNKILYVTADQDVYKSVDDGLSWHKVFDCNGCRFTAVDYFNGNIVYAGGERGIWVSKDGGESWQNISHPDMVAVNGISFWDWNYQGIFFDIKTDPNIPNTVYVCVFGRNRGLYRSRNNGETWTKILEDDFLRKVAIVPVNSNYIYATSSSAFQSGGYESGSNGIWFSQDGGKTWVKQNQNMPFPFALAIDIDNRQQPTVFVGCPGTGFQKSPLNWVYRYFLINDCNNYIQK